MRRPRVQTRGILSQTAPQSPVHSVFSDLAQLSEAGANFVRPAAIEQATVEGGNATYRDEDGILRVDEKNVLGGEMAEVHNRAAYAAYSADAQLDLGENLAELAEKFQFDPAGFKKAAEAYTQNMVKGAPGVLQAGMRTTARAEVLRRFNGLQNSMISRSRGRASSSTKKLRDTLVNDAVSLYAEGGDTEEYRAKMQEIEAVTGYRVGEEFIEENSDEGAAFLSEVSEMAHGARAARLIEGMKDRTGLTDDEREAASGELARASEAAIRKFSPKLRGELLRIDGLTMVRGMTSVDAASRIAAVSGSAPSEENLSHTRKALEAEGASISTPMMILAHEFGPDQAVAIKAAEYGAPIEDVAPLPATLKTHLAGRTAGEVVSWSERQSILKSDDIYAMGPKIRRAIMGSSLPTSEKEALLEVAQSELNRRAKDQRAIEDAEFDEVKARVDAGEVVLPLEVTQNHGISDEGQKKLVSAIMDRAGFTDRVLGAQAMLSDEGAVFDPTSTGENNDFDNLIKTGLADGEKILDNPEVTRFAAAIAVKRGRVPKTLAGALGGAINSGDIDAIVGAMNVITSIHEENPLAFDHSDSRKLAKAFLDYRFFAQFGTAEEAAAKLAEMNSPEFRQTEEALKGGLKDALEKLDSDDILAEFDTFVPFDKPRFASPMQEGVFMIEYKKLYGAEYLETNGNAELAKERTLDAMKRVYGVSEFAGGNLMKYAPEALNGRIDGSHDWMQEQLSDEMTQRLIDSGAIPAMTRDVAVPGGPVPNIIPAKAIRLVPDATTERNVNAGAAATYAVYYDANGNGDFEDIEMAPGRFYFDRSKKSTTKEEFESEVADYQSEKEFFAEIERQLTQDAEFGVMGGINVNPPPRDRAPDFMTNGPRRPSVAPTGGLSDLDLPAILTRSEPLTRPPTRPQAAAMDDGYVSDGSESVNFDGTPMTEHKGMAAPGKMEPHAVPSAPVRADTPADGLVGRRFGPMEITGADGSRKAAMDTAIVIGKRAGSMAEYDVSDFGFAKKARGLSTKVGVGVALSYGGHIDIALPMDFIAAAFPPSAEADKYRQLLSAAEAAGDRDAVIRILGRAMSEVQGGQ